MPSDLEKDSSNQLSGRAIRDMQTIPSAVAEIVNKSFSLLFASRNARWQDLLMNKLGQTFNVQFLNIDFFLIRHCKKKKLTCPAALRDLG